MKINKYCECSRVVEKVEINEGLKLIGQMTSSGMQYQLKCIDTWGESHSLMFGAGNDGIKYCP